MAVQGIDEGIQFHLRSMAEVFAIVVYMLNGLLDIQHGIGKQELFAGNSIHLLGSTAFTVYRMLFADCCIGRHLFAFHLLFQHLLDSVRHLSGFGDSGGMAVSHLRFLTVFGLFRHL